MDGELTSSLIPQESSLGRRETSGLALAWQLIPARTCPEQEVSAPISATPQHNKAAPCCFHGLGFFTSWALISKKIKK